jgi:hypothetical protein
VKWTSGKLGEMDNSAKWIKRNVPSAKCTVTIMEHIDEFLISANTYTITPSTIVFRIIHQSFQEEFPSFDFVINEAKKAADLALLKIKDHDREQFTAT